MFQTKARRFFSVLVLTAALALSPLTSASAAADDAPEGSGLLAQVQAQIVLIWDAVREVWLNVGGRMDDNG